MIAASFVNRSLSFLSHSMRFLYFTTLLGLSGTLFAQDGGQLYTTYCSACHGTDGNGVPAANSPPLSHSPWIAGSPQRAVNVVLHGLEGPVEILGKSYNLSMPPHGSVLADDAIAAILTYVRSSFGNHESAISAEIVKQVRAETSSRDHPWTAPDLLKLYPLPAEPSALKNLISRTYFGKWDKTPDFSQLTAVNVEEEHRGLISIDQAVKKGDHFGLSWEAEFEAKVEGEYEFYFDADDGGKVTINGRNIVEIQGLGPANGSRSQTGKVKLTGGLHPIRIDYYEVSGNKSIQLGWKGPGMKVFKWVSKDVAQSTKKWDEILLSPKDRPIIYRNFISGASPRAIGVGFPGGLNLAWSADHLGPDLIWEGDFIDAGRHWTDRGQGNQDPAGKVILKLSDKKFYKDTATFKGFALDSEGNPIFYVRLGEQLLSDAWKPYEKSGLVRTLTLRQGSSKQTIPLNQLPMKGEISILEFPDLLRKNGDLYQAELEPGKPLQVIYRFSH